jgi:hypothetical protein
LAIESPIWWSQLAELSILFSSQINFQRVFLF